VRWRWRTAAGAGRRTDPAGHRIGAGRTAVGEELRTVAVAVRRTAVGEEQRIAAVAARRIAAGEERPRGEKSVSIRL
jgi:hypothetical protein